MLFEYALSWYDGALRLRLGGVEIKKQKLVGNLLNVTPVTEMIFPFDCVEINLCAKTCYTCRHEPKRRKEKKMRLETRAKCRPGHNASKHHSSLSK